MTTTKPKSSKTANFLFIIVLTLIFLGLLTTTLILTVDNETPNNSKITADDLNSYQIIYSRDTENYFKESYKAYIKTWVSDDYDVYIDYINIDNLGASAILTAFKVAQISTDKVNAISRYLRKERSPQEFLNTLIDQIARPVLDDNNEPVLDDDGNAVFETDATLDLFTIILYNIGIPQLAEELIYETGITAFEFGKFVFELSYLSFNDDSVEKSLLMEIGRDYFSYLISDIANIYMTMREISNATSLTYADGRVLRETLFEQGARLRLFLDAFGAEKLELLLGIGSELLSASNDNDFGLTDAETHAINGLSVALLGSFDLILKIIADLFITIPNSFFDTTIDYINDNQEANFLYSSLIMIRTLNASIEKTLAESELSVLQVANMYSEILAYIDILESDDFEFNQSSFEENKVSEANLLVNLYSLSISIAVGNYSNISSVSDILNCDSSTLASLKSDISQFQYLLTRSSKGIESAFTILCFGLFVKLINQFQ
ncbi:MAG: hypothetical protein LBF68_00405 [Christensenellaceae bacterium]|nr:hypothetical protein [Christensenellaceae bacterium]